MDTISQVREDVRTDTEQSSPAPRTPGRPWLGRSATLIGLGILVFIALRSALVPPPVVPATASGTEFSAERAMVHLREIARAPRPAGSAEHARVREYILAELRALGLEPEVQEATGVASRYPEAGRVLNIAVRMEGAAGEDRAILLMTHYDGVPAGPAAADAGSGVVTLLETLRALRAGGPVRNDIIALFTDQEENGLVGAAAFVDEHPWVRDIEVALNFEARGTSGRSLMFETGASNAAVVGALADAVPGASASSLMYEAYRRMPNDTDFTELKRLGIPGLNFAFVGDVGDYHTPNDAVDRVDPRSVQHHGQAALALARHFGDLETAPGGGGDAAFFDVPLLGLIAYPLDLAFPLALLASVSVLVSLVIARRRGMGRPADTTIGYLGAAGAAVLAAGSAGMAVAGAGALHGLLEDPGIPALSPLYAIMGAAVGLTAAVTVQLLLSRWAGVYGLFTGAVALCASVALLAGALLPGGSHLFTWPAMGGALAIGLAAARPHEETGRSLGFASWLAIIPAVLLLVPFAALLPLLIGSVPASAAAIGLVVGLISTLAAPQLRLLSGTWPWAIPALGAVAAGILLVVGLSTIRHDVEQPWRNGVVYTLDAESREARWVRAGGADDPWLARLFGDAGVHGVVDGRFALPRRYATRPPDEILSAPAPAVPLATPSVELLDNSAGADGRTLRLRVTSAPGALTTYLRAEGDVRAASIDGRPIRAEGYRFRTSGWSLDYSAPPEDGVELVLLVSDDQPLRLTVADAFAGLPEAPGIAPPRPRYVVPLGSGDLTVAGRVHTF